MNKKLKVMKKVIYLMWNEVINKKEKQKKSVLIKYLRYKKEKTYNKLILLKNLGRKKKRRTKYI